MITKKVGYKRKQRVKDDVGHRTAQREMTPPCTRVRFRSPRMTHPMHQRRPHSLAGHHPCLRGLLVAAGPLRTAGTAWSAKLLDSFSPVATARPPPLPRPRAEPWPAAICGARTILVGHLGAFGGGASVPWSAGACWCCLLVLMI